MYHDADVPWWSRPALQQDRIVLSVVQDWETLLTRTANAQWQCSSHFPEHKHSPRFFHRIQKCCFSLISVCLALQLSFPKDGVTHSEDQRCVSTRSVLVLCMDSHACLRPAACVSRVWRWLDERSRVCFVPSDTPLYSLTAERENAEVELY